ncbi:DNA polymerase alpha-associated DNA helicase A-like [Rutidosis leptorrhynchoides]|uniref:DNA polymerase alpha-associated DNA helicase A-like n=1 Tax=Rutidosis leptorrhynchoides TaxID=125765 RepID=UPI003A991456
MELFTFEEKPENRVHNLVNEVFSWSLSDVLNRNLYNEKVSEIPMTFSSVTEYKTSFVYPLFEETHEDLRSKILGVKRCPTAGIVQVRKSPGLPPKVLHYTIKLRIHQGSYEPQCGDLIALTDVKPKFVDDLERPNKSYVIAIVQGAKTESSIYFVLSSKPLNEQGVGVIQNDVLSNTAHTDLKHFVVYLTNVTTNIRISQALYPEREGDQKRMLEKLIQIDSFDEESCVECSIDKTREWSYSNIEEAIKTFKLDSSQEAAVLSGIDSRYCSHRNTIKLIWGPPGTGKTKTISSLLYMLLKMNCRTLTCAPTNIAVLGVTKRVMSLMRDNMLHDTYGLGDILLFGNEERMKIKDQHDLLNIFLNQRVKILAGSLAPRSGWQARSESLIRFFKDPEIQYQSYVTEKQKFIEALKKEKSDEKSVKENISTFEQFVLDRIRLNGHRLISIVKNLYTHIPTSFISEEIAKEMIRLIKYLKLFEELLVQTVADNVVLKEAKGKYDSFNAVRTSILQIFENLQNTLCIPEFKENYEIKAFCMTNACLVFCTASSSINLHTSNTKPLEFLVIDEAAQLKECESLIPFSLEGLRHAILVGDERQLPAMVQSKTSAEAEFGRSLFERFVLLGHKKHLLNVQYRMHPSISRFPNKEFYNNQILDGMNVKNNAYEKRFLQENVYGSYSFINVTSAKEDFDRNQSLKNLTEVAVATEIIASLFKEAVASKRKVSVGCISPYKAQVTAIQEKIGDKYSSYENYFSVNVRSVDGFQGSEEDVIIISTVRCNVKGSIGFLSNHQRTNVALTRARFCLWILGNGSTLLKSGSIWKQLVLDAKDRGCFHDANEDKNLAEATMAALVEFCQLDSLFSNDSVLFSEAKWKVKFSDTFMESIARYTEIEIRKEVVSLVGKLSRGWRKDDDDKVQLEGTCMYLDEYNVTQNLRLIWTVDVVAEDSLCIQVLKMWDILLPNKVQELAKILTDKVYGNYTVNMINRCKEKQVDGNVTLPVSWPLNSDTDDSWILAKQFAALSLKNERASSSRSSSGRRFGNRNSNRYGDSRSRGRGSRW